MSKKSLRQIKGGEKVLFNCIDDEGNIVESLSLKFDLNAVAELEIAYGTFQEAMDKLQEGSFVAVRKILWIGTQHLDREDLTEKKCGSLVGATGGSLRDAAELLAIAFKGDMPEPVEPEEEDPNQKGPSS